MKLRIEDTRPKNERRDILSPKHVRVFFDDKEMTNVSNVTIEIRGRESLVRAHVDMVVTDIEIDGGIEAEVKDNDARNRKTSNQDRSGRAV